MRYSRIIFVCQDNTTLSPMAEAIFRDMVKSSDVEVLSRGLVVLFPEPLNDFAREALLSHQMDFTKETTTPFSLDEVNDETLILTMTISQSIKIAQEYGLTEQVFTLRKFDREEEGDIKDPFGGGLLEYQTLYQELSELIRKMIVNLD